MLERCHLTTPRLIASLGALAALVAVAATPQLLGSRVSHAVSGLGGASRPWLAVAAGGFLVAVLCAVAAWRAAIVACGGRIGFGDASARYGVGALVNSFVPAKLGDAVRIALFSKALDGPERIWTTGGVYAALMAAHCLTLAGFVLAASASGALPAWPALALCAVVVALAAAAWLARGSGRFAHFFEALATLERSPRAAAQVIAWMALSSLARMGAAAAVAVALGVSHPLLAALVIIPAIDLAGAMPLTPGNIGVVSGAVAVALQSRGIGMTQALSTGIAFHAVETLIGISFGSLSGLYLVRSRPAVRRWTVRVALVGACLTLAFAFSALVLDLV